ncbi:protein kinase [Candidatus Margulisiibacteriota bacterium]
MSFGIKKNPPNKKLSPTQKTPLPNDPQKPKITTKKNQLTTQKTHNLRDILLNIPINKNKKKEKEKEKEKEKVNEEIDSHLKKQVKIKVITKLTPTEIDSKLSSLPRNEKYDKEATKILHTYIKESKQTISGALSLIDYYSKYLNSKIIKNTLTNCKQNIITNTKNKNHISSLNKKNYRAYACDKAPGICISFHLFAISAAMDIYNDDDFISEEDFYKTLQVVDNKLIQKTCLSWCFLNKETRIKNIQNYLDKTHPKLTKTSQNFLIKIINTYIEQVKPENFNLQDTFFLGLIKGERIDKKKSNKTFTIIKSPNGEEYELLNTISIKYAKKKGLDKEESWINKNTSKSLKFVLGEGQTGKVRLARNINTGDILAVKKMDSKYYNVALIELGNAKKAIGEKEDLVSDIVLTESSKSTPRIYYFMPLLRAKPLPHCFILTLTKESLIKKNIPEKDAILLIKYLKEFKIIKHNNEIKIFDLNTEVINSKAKKQFFSQYKGLKIAEDRLNRYFMNKYQEFILLLGKYDKELNSISSNKIKKPLKTIYNVSVKMLKEVINLHKNKLFHEDLHTYNVLLNPKNLEEVHICDFTLSTSSTKLEKREGLRKDYPHNAPELYYDNGVKGKTTEYYNPEIGDYYSAGKIIQTLFTYSDLDSNQLPEFKTVINGLLNKDTNKRMTLQTALLILEKNAYKYQ